MALILNTSCSKHHLQEVSHWKRRGRVANNRHRGEEATRGRGETDTDASEDLIMMGMWSHERNTFCTPPPANISQVNFKGPATQNAFCRSGQRPQSAAADRVLCGRTLTVTI